MLLATDLSSRCDRALDRAAQLAEQWQAELLVIHVLDPREGFIERRHLDDLPSWRRPPDRKALAEARVRADLPEGFGRVTVRVEEGNPAGIIDEIARAEGCDLVVTGVARDETLGRYFLGATVDHLVRRTPVPILIVKSRAKPYREIVVATDFSESSRHALNAAAAFFPHAALTLLHAFEVPFAGLLDNGDFRDRLRIMQQEASDKFVTESDLTEDQRRALHVLVEYGAPELMIRAYMQARGANLVALGTHGRSAVFDVLIGSTAKRILELAPADVLLVREPRATVA
jgi:nucleotide-binding universal stress UspA family protein